MRLQLTSLWADRYAEYGLAKATQGVSLASMQNAAGFYVQPSEVVNNYNITAVFGDDFAVPSSLVSRAWANVSLFQSSKLALAWSHANLPPLYVYACDFSASLRRPSIVQHGLIRWIFFNKYVFAGI